MSKWLRNSRKAQLRGAWEEVQKQIDNCPHRKQVGMCSYWCLEHNNPCDSTITDGYCELAKGLDAVE